MKKYVVFRQHLAAHILLKYSLHDHIHCIQSCKLLLCLFSFLCCCLFLCYISSGVTGHSSLTTGNGVVIHLPGLFEEAEKNGRKGKGVFEYPWNTNTVVLGLPVHVSEAANRNLTGCDSRSGGLGDTARHFWPRPYRYVQLLFLGVHHYQECFV